MISKKQQTRVFKVKPIKTSSADSKFSLWIRKRDGKCMRCGSTDKPLDNSHYWKRGDSGTRYDPENCDSACRECHTIWEKQKNNEYRDWKIRQLGIERYNMLEFNARTFMSRRDSVLAFMKWHKQIILEYGAEDFGNRFTGVMRDL